MALPLIAWDVDDVLNDLMGNWFEGKWLPEHPGCRLHFTDLTQNSPERLLGVEREAYLQSLDEYRLTKYQSMEPDKNALRWFRDCGEQYRHVVVSAVSLKAVHISAEWVYRHFGQWMRGFFVAPTSRGEKLVEGYPTTKQDIFQGWIRPDVFIDDNPANIAQAKACNIPAILRKKPWAPKGDEWAAIAAKFEKLRSRDGYVDEAF